MVWGTRRRATAARRSAGVMVAIATGSLIVMATVEALARDAVVAAGSVGQPVDAAAQRLVDRVGQDGWDVFKARVAVRRQMIAADGLSVAAPATTEYTWERTRRPAGWKTTMTMVAGPEVRVRARSGMVTLPQPPTVVKIEDLGDGSAPRFWARNGAEIKMPTPAVQTRVIGPGATMLGAAMAEEALRGAQAIRALPPVGVTNWIDAFVLPASRRPQRLAAFERQFGQRSGVVRGLSRYLSRHGDTEREVLVDEEGGVPVETNLVARGELIAHSTFAYDRAVSGALIRRGVRTERVLAGSGGTRMVTEVSFGDITVEQRGGR